MSLADLETIAEFVEGPDVFLHYIERRLAAQLGQTELVGDEIRLFGAYLKTRLPESMFLDDEGRRLSFISFADTHLKFDEAMEFRRGERSAPPDIRLEVPAATSAILAELRKRQKDPTSRWIAHCLLSLSNDQLGALDQVVSAVKERWPAPGRFGRGVYHAQGLVICAVTGADHPAWLLRDQAKRVTMIEKYRRKAERAVCFAIDLRDSQRPFLTALWIESKWKQDPTMERLASEDAAVPVGKIPGPNQHCFCGSGKKFKKCCRSRLIPHRSL